MVICLDKQHESKKILLNIFVKGCHQLSKMGRLKALVWFWIIDETLGLTFDLSVWIRKGSPIQVVELDDGHGEGDSHKRDDQML